MILIYVYLLFVDDQGLKLRTQKYFGVKLDIQVDRRFHWFGSQIFKLKVVL
jgi:hypothetical protein